MEEIKRRRRIDIGNRENIWKIKEYKYKDVKYGSLFTTLSQLLTLLKLTVLMPRYFKEESWGSHSMGEFGSIF